MHSHTWDCEQDHSLMDCPRDFPTSNVRVITAFDRHAQQALNLASNG